MKVMNSYRFLDEKAEMTGVVAEPNDGGMEYAQASGSILCGCVLAKKSTMCAHLFHVV